MHYKVAAFFHLKPPEGTPTPKWIAMRELKNLRNANLEMQKYMCPLYEAIINDELPQFFCAELKRKSENSFFPPYEEAYSVHRNRLVGISSTLHSIMNERLIKDLNVIAAINNFFHYDWSAFRGENLTTPEEKELINKILDLVIVYLKREYKLE
ncbi:MAG: hypothetical protein NTX79_00845 [Candidatus Micrarchaeota archaeon]|nr:hypothetical protein [Candidatus Micrarchaeota archaeon]